jgi:hypothetical protein
MPLSMHERCLRWRPMSVCSCDKRLFIDFLLASLVMLPRSGFKHRADEQTNVKDLCCASAPRTLDAAVLPDLFGVWRLCSDNGRFDSSVLSDPFLACRMITCCTLGPHLRFEASWKPC